MNSANAYGILASDGTLFDDISSEMLPPEQLSSKLLAVTRAGK
jgi:hypothetical protein